MDLYPVTIAGAIVVSGLMLALGYSWGQGQQKAPVPVREVVTSDSILSDYIEAADELLGRWSISEDQKQVTYTDGKYQLRWRNMGILTDTFYFDPMLQYAWQARRVRLNTPAERRALRFDYRATMHNESVGPELFRAMSFLRHANYDAETGTLAIEPHAWEEVQRIYLRASDTQLTKDWERRKAEIEAEGTLQ
jgi:hypothetical protein